MRTAAPQFQKTTTTRQKQQQKKIRSIIRYYHYLAIFRKRENGRKFGQMRLAYPKSTKISFYPTLLKFNYWNNLLSKIALVIFTVTTGNTALVILPTTN